MRAEPTYENYAKAAGRALDRLGDTKHSKNFDANLEKFLGNMYHKVRSNTGWDRVSEEWKRSDQINHLLRQSHESVFGKGTKDTGSMMVENIRAREVLAKNLLREKDSFAPNEARIRRLEKALELLDEDSLNISSAAGGTLQAFQVYGQNLHNIKRIEHRLLTLQDKALRAIGQKQKNYLQGEVVRARNIMEQAYKKLYDGKQSWGNQAVSLGLRATADNLLGSLALLAAAMSSASSMVGEVYYYGLKSNMNPMALMTAIRRSRASFVGRMKHRYFSKAGHKELIDELTGVKKVTKDRLEIDPVATDTMAKKALNAASGTSLQMLRETDYSLSAAFESFAEQIALQRTIAARLAEPGATPKKVYDEIQSAVRKGKAIPDFTVRYIDEIQRTIDWTLFRADLHETGSWLHDVGVLLHRVALTTKYMPTQHPAYRFGVGQLSFFSKTAGNVLASVANNSPLGAVGPIAARRYHEAGGGLKGVGNILTNRQKLMPTLPLMGWLLLKDNDEENWIEIIDVKEPSASMSRRFGIASGLRIGERVFEWRYFGIFGELTRAHLAVRDITELMIGDGYPVHPSTERAMSAFSVAYRYIVEDSWLGMGLMKFMTMLRYQNASGMEQAGEYLKNLIPGRGAVRRAETAAYGGLRSRNVDQWYSEFLEAVDDATPRAVRVDMFGTPWSSGEEREKTREAVDLHDRLIWFFVPTIKGKQPKGNQLSKWIVESGGFDHGDVKIGDKWYPHSMFHKHLGTTMTNIIPAARSIRTRTGEMETLHPDDYNNKLHLMGINQKFSQKLIDSYLNYYENKSPDNPLVQQDRQAVALLRHFRQTFSTARMRGLVGLFYPGMKEDTRMVDVLHHIATADKTKLPGHIRSRYVHYRNAMKNTLRSKQLYSQEAHRFTDEEIDEFAERSVRLFFIRNFYKTMENLANQVISLSPELDRMAMERYYSTKEE